MYDTEDQAYQLRNACLEAAMKLASQLPQAVTAGDLREIVESIRTLAEAACVASDSVPKVEWERVP